MATAAFSSPAISRRGRIATATLRIAAGIGLVFHGLAHAVFPMRGSGDLEGPLPLRIVTTLGWQAAIIGFVATGFAILGVAKLREAVRPLAYAGVMGSIVSFAAHPSADLAFGFVATVGATVLLMREVVNPTRLHPRAWRALDVFAWAILLFVGVQSLSRPFHRRWGSTAEERRMDLPGDSPVARHAAYEVNHAITINATPAEVWPWVAAIGQDRAGFYSYDWLENLFLLDIHSADRVKPSWIERKVGDRVHATPPRYLGGLFGHEPLGWKITHFEPERALVLQYWGAFVLRATPDARTRLIVRTKMGDPHCPVVGAAITFVTLDFQHFVMERKMLRGIAERAEQR